MHGGLPRGLGVAVVAVPKQRPTLRLLDRDATVVFVRRSVERLEVEAARSDLGRLAVTTIEQTVLDLAHRPQPGGIPDEARAAVASLWPRVDVPKLRRLAGEQRLGAAADRAADWAGA